MTIKVAINGFGRIGRNILRALYESKHSDQIKVVAINNLADIHTNAHLLKYDTTHGKFQGDIQVEGDYIIVNGDRIRNYCEPDVNKMPWKEHDIDVLYACSGLFTSREKAALHVAAGAKKVIISAPGGKDVDATIVYGVNDNILKPDYEIISNASCTTNCLAPLVKPLNDDLGIVNGLMTTIHAFTNDQVLADGNHSDLRRARAATQSMIPTKTGAASAVGLVLPELDGKLDGIAIRVPTLNVSLVDLTFQAARETSVEEVNSILEKAAAGPLNGVLEINREPLVSIDFNHNPASSIFDVTQTKVIGDQVKVFAWYDNEWGFSNRMLDTTIAWMNA